MPARAEVGLAVDRAEEIPVHTMRLVRLVGRGMMSMLSRRDFARRCSKTAREKYPVWKSAMDRAVVVHNTTGPRNWWGERIAVVRKQGLTWLFLWERTLALVSSTIVALLIQQQLGTELLTRTHRKKLGAS
jgi:hypothetical protein